MTDDNELAISEAMVLACVADFQRDSRKVTRKCSRRHGFGKEMQYEVQDITGVIAPNDWI